MPKLLLNSTGDQFFLPDATRYYFSDLRGGENYIYNAPNTDHGLRTNGVTDPGVLESVYSFYNSVVRGTQRPTLTWRYDSVNPGLITVETSIRPKEVRLWQSTNPDNRDFRLAPENIAPPTPPATQASFYVPQGAKASPWTSIALNSDTNQYVAQVPVPGAGEGWRAFYVEATFANFGQAVNIYGNPSRLESTDFRCTTECRVVPDTEP